MPTSSQLETTHPVHDTELFRALFEHALDAVLISDDCGVYVAANQAACALIGLPCEEIVGRQVGDFFDMGPTASVEAAWNSFMDQGVMQGECWVRRPDGQLRCCSFRAKANFIPNLHMSFLRDITDQKESIHALHDSNRKLSLLSNVSRELLANYHPQTLMDKLFSDVCAELGLDVYLNFLVHDGGRLRLGSCGGIAPERAAQLEWLDFGQAVCGTVAVERSIRVVEDVQNSHDPLTELIRDLGIQAYVCHPLLHGDELLGTLSFGSRTRSIFRPDELQLMRVVADGLSIALHRAALLADFESHNSELKRANEELGRSNAELYHFAYAVGHDLKAPLRTVASFAQLLMRRVDARDPEVREFVSIIENAVFGMNKFLDDLLRYAQVGSTAKVNYLKVHSKLLLDWALMNLDSEVKHTGATITQDALPAIRADQSQIVQLFQNLIGNALKYCSEAPPSVHVSSSREENAAVFSIKDNGVGIEAKYHADVFGIFKRLHGAGTPGNGIGLALCKRIVENHGGRIWVESDGHSGSTFYFTLPD